MEWWEIVNCVMIIIAVGDHHCLVPGSLTGNTIHDDKKYLFRTRSQLNDINNIFVWAIHLSSRELMCSWHWGYCELKYRGDDGHYSVIVSSMFDQQSIYSSSLITPVPRRYCVIVDILVLWDGNYDILMPSLVITIGHSMAFPMCINHQLMMTGMSSCLHSSISLTPL